eukprot:jgi/Chlat1/5655/Chrsp37S00872
MDLWTACSRGTLAEVEAALAASTSSSRNKAIIDAVDAHGATALGIAVWRNRLAVIRRLLEAGANPDAQNGRTGWTALHQALHMGHVRAVALLLEANSALHIEDHSGRTSLDLISEPLQPILREASAFEVHSWGSGVNFTLGTGSTGIQLVPSRVDALHGLDVKLVAAAKFHSAALTSDGQLFTWGFGRGGRLGQPDFHIHNGEVAIIKPERVLAGLEKKVVVAVAVAKHHTIAATDAGECYTWGSNRDGRLGYTAVDTQPTPRKVTALRVRVTAVAASNKHSAVLTNTGEVYTWGCNDDGQLGYGTCNSVSSYKPRLVDSLKGKAPGIQMSISKRHNMVLLADGEVHTWGFKQVMPRRVLFLKDQSSGDFQIQRHQRPMRLRVVELAAGAAHSTVLTEDGAVFFWVTALTRHNCVAVASGKARTAVVTSSGDVWMWDGSANAPSQPYRVPGLKRAVAVSVGEKHSLALIGLSLPKLQPPNAVQVAAETPGQVEEEDEDDGYFDMDGEWVPGRRPQRRCKGPIQPLTLLCEEVLAKSCAEPRNALQLLGIADALGADTLKAYCQGLVLRNLDHVLLMVPHALRDVRPPLLAELEALMAAGEHGWHHRPRPVLAVPPPLSEMEEEAANQAAWHRSPHSEPDSCDQQLKEEDDTPAAMMSDGLDSDAVTVVRQARAVRKKLQQIAMLEAREAEGHQLDAQQRAKTRAKPALEAALQSLQQGTPLQQPLPGGPHARKHSEDLRNKPPLAATPRHEQPASKQKLKKAYSGPAATMTAGARFLEAESSVEDEVGPSLQDEFNGTAFAAEGESNRTVIETLNTNPSRKGARKEARRLSLSSFLSGEDTVPKAARNVQVQPLAEPVAPAKPALPAWGGITQAINSATKLSDIQQQQQQQQLNMNGSSSALRQHASSNSKGASSSQSVTDDEEARQRLSLAQFVKKTPAPKVKTTVGSPVSWQTTSTSTVPSLKDIQSREERLVAQRRRSIGPALSDSTSATPPSRDVPGMLSSSPSSLSSPLTLPDQSPNRWYRPSEPTPSSLRKIQVEETAMKELRKRYGSVRIVISEQQ